LFIIYHRFLENICLRVYALVDYKTHLTSEGDSFIGLSIEDLSEEFEGVHG